MFGEIFSALIGGLFGPVIGKIFGRFRPWKVFFVSLTSIYVGIFLMGLLGVGYRVTIAVIPQFFTPFAIILFVALSIGVTFISVLGRAAIRNRKNEVEKTEEIEH